LVDPIQSPAIVAAQAALAKPASRGQEAIKPERLAASAEPSRTEMAPAAPKLVAGTGIEALPQQPVQTPVKSLVQAPPGTMNQDPNFVAGKPDGPAAETLEPALAMAESLAPKAALPPQTSSVRFPDGSSLAALANLPRTSEPGPLLLPTAPLAARQASTPAVQIEGGLKWMLKGGVQEAQLQLHPDSLGQVTIHLRVEGGEVHARIWITEPTSMQAVRDGRSQLEMSLKEQGLQLGSFDLQQGQHSFQETPSAPVVRERSLPDATPTRQEAPAPPLPSILNPHHVELYA
jgi:flagellar hook-length control protein FliK